MNEAQFELLLAITLSVLLRPPAPSAARLTQIMVPTGGGTRSRWDRHDDTDEARAVRLAPGTHSLNLR
jgi:hypothetical protein